MTIKRLGVLSVGLIHAVIGAFIGLLIGIFYGILISVAGSATQQTGVFAGLGIAMVIVMPILYGAFSFIGGIIFAALYNLGAKWTGGVKMETTN